MMVEFRGCQAVKSTVYRFKSTNKVHTQSNSFVSSSVRTDVTDILLSLSRQWLDGHLRVAIS